LIRLQRPVLAILAALVLISANACSSPAATRADASSIITQVINGGSAVQSFHFTLAAAGTIKAAALSDAGGAAGGLSGDLELDGASIEGDVDVTGQAAHLTLAVPARGLSGDVIVAGGASYSKISLLGLAPAKYTKKDLASVAGGYGIAIPTPGPSGLAALGDQIQLIWVVLEAVGVKATLVGVDQIGGKDANHINISVPLDLLNNQIASAASPSPAPKIDSASVDMWVYTDSNRPAQVEIKGASSTFGNLDITLTISNYDQPVTVTAPSADQVNATTTP
jgi:hypothetical protein